MNKNILKPPSTVEDLRKFVTNKIQESLHLDYKDSRALTHKKNKDEIVKDVTAFANADGGMIIYGIQEDSHHLPIELDQGVDDELINKEWLEQIILSNIRPYLSGLIIHQIPVEKNKSFYVISINKSYQGPHQASDKKYYKRYNFQSCPMDHYEIVDISNRKKINPSLIRADIQFINLKYYLEIANISDFIIQNVIFQLDKNLVWPNRLSKKIPGPLKNGISYFPAKKTFYFEYLNTNIVGHEISKLPRECKELNLIISYINPEINEEINEQFIFNLEDYDEGLIHHANNEDLTNELGKGLSNIVSRLDNIIYLLQEKNR